MEEAEREEEGNQKNSNVLVGLSAAGGLVVVAGAFYGTAKKRNATFTRLDEDQSRTTSEVSPPSSQQVADV